MPPSLRLPAALRDQVESELNLNSRKRKRPGLGRKEARKQARQEEKQRRAQFFTHSKPPGAQQKENAFSVRLSSGPRTENLKNDNVNAKKVSLLTRPAKEKKKEPELTAQISGPDSKEDPEDARIAWLEAKLGIGSSKKAALFDDGLDGKYRPLFPFCPNSHSCVSDLMENLDRIVPRVTTSRGVLDTAFTASAESEEEDLQSELENQFSDFEGFPFDVYHDSPPTAPAVALPQVDPSQKQSIGTETRYIPPHLRAASNNSENLMKLVRQLKGLLNRLSEPNLTSIVNSIEEVYREHPKHDVTSSLTQLIIDSIALHSSHLDAFVILHATLVGSLYKLMGIDFAAHFVQTLNDKYHHHYKISKLSNSENENEAAIDPNESRGKECLNLIILFSELYNFQIISCVLVYDLIRELLDGLDEIDVELLLKILRNSGQQLRQDDPSALKDIVDIVQSKVAGKVESTISSRTQFMIETLTNLKNNKLKRSANPDVHTEQVERMKKFLTGLIIAHEPLRVSLEDLRSAEKRGKWWIVGAAWNGNPLVDKADEIHQLASKTQNDDSLWKLARKQGMNTDVRRSIFVVLMSSDSNPCKQDYIDACERFSQLNLSEIQRREIIRVVLHCLGNEKQYNPYYTLVLQHLAQDAHSYKVTLQYCFWDFLRQMGEKEVGGAEILKNLQDNELDFDTDTTPALKRLHFARAFAWLIAKGYSSLLILKPVDFTRLKPQTKVFMQNLFFHIFLNSQVSSPAITLDRMAAKYLSKGRDRVVLEEVFIKVLRVPTLTQGLLFYLGNVLGVFDGDDDILSQTMQWCCDVALNTLRGTVDIEMDS
ncbi:hypothetical protein Clacol_002475 [Clathrus columnatus]|uniref:MI domain-containing protein n=1 Tax=Clathrus columnatus TaxID=1419009 RepID=A0AAV5A1X9_9AGAM|nr:hypothetical protein Clacol_002475 [Clathrus columnatus]